MQHNTDYPCQRIKKACQSLIQSDMQRLQLDKALELLYQWDLRTTTPLNGSIKQRGLAMANYAREVHGDFHTLISCLIYPVFIYCPIDQDSTMEHFDAATQQLLQQATRVSTLKLALQPNKKNHDKLLTQLILSYIDDARVVLIRMSEICALLEFLRHHDTPERQLIAQQAMTLYAPIANQLGIRQLKWQLQDYAFRYLNPSEYQHIKSCLNTSRHQREHHVQQLCQQVTQLLDQANIPTISVKGRAKSIFSIHQKMCNKSLSFDQISDCLALRIIVADTDSCYQALSMIQDHWQTVEDEYDDYIQRPKANGYQSIHCIVHCDRQRIEMQIRSQAMHLAAEHGDSSHWTYKDSGHEKAYQQKINRLQQVLNWNANQAITELNLKSFFEERIYVFTPKGDVHQLKHGCTGLDLAYKIHTHIGHQCHGVIINKRIAPLSTPLNTGDLVEILTKKNNTPSKQWLDKEKAVAQSPATIRKIRSYFAKEQRDQHIADGQKHWQKHCSKTGCDRSLIQQALERFSVKTIDDLYAQIGSHELSIQSIESAIQRQAAHDSGPVIKKKTQRARPKQVHEPILIDGKKHIKTTIARCCSPMHGDPIVALISLRRGLVVHRQNCQYVIHSSKQISAHWDSITEHRHSIVSLLMETNGDIDISHEVTKQLVNQQIALIAFDRQDNIITLAIQIDTRAALITLMNQLKAIKGVHHISQL